MKTTIIPIGNSKGVRIPKALLEESGLEGEVELKPVKGGIKILAAPKPKTAKKTVRFNDEYLMSLPVLGRDWNRPEEDEAWKHLQ